MLVSPELLRCCGSNEKRRFHLDIYDHNNFILRLTFPKSNSVRLHGVGLPWTSFIPESNLPTGISVCGAAFVRSSSSLAEEDGNETSSGDGANLVAHGSGGGECGFLGD